jgi:drug/metabolite transporter, DME family
LTEELADTGEKTGTTNSTSWIKLAGYGEVILTCMIWGSAWIVVKYLNYPFQVILFYRVLFCAITLAILFTVRRQWSLTVPKGDRWWLLGVVLALPLAWITGFFAVKLNPVTFNSLVYNIGPVFTVLLAALILREKGDRAVYVALPVSLVGVALVVLANTSDFSTLSTTIFGAFAIMVAAFTQALQVVFMKRGGRHYSGLVIVFYSALVAMVVLGPFALTSGVQLSLVPLLLMFVLGTVHTIGAYGIYIHGIRSVKAKHAAILGYVEPASAAFLAIIIFGEGFTLLTIIGGALIAIASYYIIRRQRTVSESEQKQPELTA